MTNPADQFRPTSNPSFPERRTTSEKAVPPGVERRQFSNSYHDLSPLAKELAVAVDEYKIQHHRRFVTFDEMLSIIQSLGYAKTTS